MVPYFIDDFSNESLAKEKDDYHMQEMRALEIALDGTIWLSGLVANILQILVKFSKAVCPNVWKVSSLNFVNCVLFCFHVNVASSPLLLVGKSSKLGLFPAPRFSGRVQIQLSTGFDINNSVKSFYRLRLFILFGSCFLCS